MAAEMALGLVVLAIVQPKQLGQLVHAVVGLLLWLRLLWLLRLLGGLGGRARARAGNCACFLALLLGRHRAQSSGSATGLATAAAAVTTTEKRIRQALGVR